MALGKTSAMSGGHAAGLDQLRGSALDGYWYWIEWGTRLSRSPSRSLYVSARRALPVASNAPDVSARPLQTPAVATADRGFYVRCSLGERRHRGLIKKEFARIEGKFGENLRLFLTVQMLSGKKLLLRN
jgi:hypothetical protein